ncbi:MAG: flagellar biosynthesis anti-sigma factor FlgM [Bdellovibrionales bacterium]|nr:flagellar biosynthesis anti-sigma factor FlgM [Bdellovibrionales bacterium]
MKITHNKVGQRLNISDSGKAEKSSESKESKGLRSSDKSSSSSAAGDATKIILSDRAQEARKIKELAMSAPDVDQAKVDKFRKLIDEGKYKVDAKAVADKMVDDELSILN